MNVITKRTASYRSAIEVAPFRKLLFGQGLSMIGDAICLAALPVALIRAELSGGVFGIVMAGVGGGTVVGAIAGGVLADRSSPKRVLIATDTARGLAQILATILIIVSAPWWVLVLAYLVFGIGIGVSRPCVQVLLVSLLPKNALIAGNGLMNLIDNVVAVVFPATVGVLIIVWDPVWGILIDGVTFFLAATISMLIPDIGSLEDDDELSFKQALSGIGVIAADRRLALGFAATLVVNVLCFPVFLVVAPYAVSERFDSTLWGFCLAASGLGACVGSVLVVVTEGHRRLVTLALTCGVVLSAAMTVLGTGQHRWVVVVGAILVGVVEASWLTGWATAMQVFSPETELGKVVAIDTVATNGALPFVYLGSGLVGAAIGYLETLTATAVVSAIATVSIGLAAVSCRSPGRGAGR